jgi:hypothetical protein
MMTEFQMFGVTLMSSLTKTIQESANVLDSRIAGVDAKIDAVQTQVSGVARR